MKRGKTATDWLESRELKRIASQREHSVIAQQEEQILRLALLHFHRDAVVLRSDA
jgi:hypothetical protein